ncbi:alpha-L-rhamnosidase-related protein [Gemmiger sp.]
MDRKLLNTNWIWLPDWTPEDAADARIVYFRKEFAVNDDSLSVERKIRISADSRYKLYVNGSFVQEGPQKALNLKEWYVDSADIAPYLVSGVNVAAVEVLRFAAGQNDSLYCSDSPCLYVEDAPGTDDALSGKSGWKCMLNHEIRIFGEEGRPAPIHAQEDVCATDFFSGWKLPWYDAAAWKDAAPKMILSISRSDAPYNLLPRSIPTMRHESRHFAEIMNGSKRFAVLINRDEPISIPPHTKEVVELSAGAEECGYLLYAFAGGSGARVSTLCAECYAYPQPAQPSPLGGTVPTQPQKGDRTDTVNGQLCGHTSHYTVAGYGTPLAPECYEPYWFRTFRFVRLEIETVNEPLTILRFSYRSTGYPLEMKTSFCVSEPTYAPIWDISVRTLARCMHETYVDCPFYEQLQYAMDTRSEILYTYAVSADDRLARQAMEAFRCSQRPDGLINADAPTVKSNVIPSFSIYYLLMVYDHMMYFGDKALVKRHLPAIDGILAFFDRNLAENGMVGKIGGPIMRHERWSFIDWSRKWDSGVPTVTQMGSGAITMESLLYLYGLQKVSALAAYADRIGLAEEYTRRAAALADAVCKSAFGCREGVRLVQDGPGLDEYSVHCQVFAVLTGLVDPTEGKEMLATTVGNPDLAQASVAFMFYLFRALEICGWYEKTNELWELWRKMLHDNLTTCVENDTDARSDCHAWGALMCYEIPAVILGVRPAAPGFEKAVIAPQMGALTKAAGDVATPKGMVHVEWTRTRENRCEVKYLLPEGMTAVQV